MHTDHANLTYWKNPGDHNRRVAQWHGELMDYNFELVHISGKKNRRADALSRRLDYEMGEEDNKQLVVLPPKFFEHALARVAGSEEVDPNDPKFLESMGITRGIPGFQTLQNLVEQDQQENPKSQETIR